MKPYLLILSFGLLLCFTSFQQHNDHKVINNRSNIISPELRCPAPPSLAQTIRSDNAKQTAGNSGNDFDQGWYQKAMEQIQKDEYNISYSEELGAYQSPNRANNIRFIYHKDGFTAKTRSTKIPKFDVNDRTLKEKEKEYETVEDWSVKLKVESGELKVESGELKVESGELKVESGELKVESGELKVESGELKVESGELKVESGELKVESGELKVESGELKVESGELKVENACTLQRGENRVENGHPVLSSPRVSSGDPQFHVAGNKAWIENEKMRIDYTNTKDGMRQDFIIKEKPVGIHPFANAPLRGGTHEGKLRLNLSAETKLKMIVGADALLFKNDRGEEKMKYSALKVWDANGKELRAYFEKNNYELGLRITN